MGKKCQKSDISLNISSTELKHLRDLMSILLPSGDKSISKMLAEIENREVEEKTLWVKVFDVCAKNGVPVGESAPDHAIVATGMPDITVVSLQIEKEFDEE